MNEKEALNKGGFTYNEIEGEYNNITHCGEECEIICHFPGINTVECKKCGMQLTQKILLGQCFLNNSLTK